MITMPLIMRNQFQFKVHCRCNNDQNIPFCVSNHTLGSLNQGKNFHLNKREERFLDWKILHILFEYNLFTLINGQLHRWLYIKENS